jgi:invasion protein IalB
MEDAPLKTGIKRAGRVASIALVLIGIPLALDATEADDDVSAAQRVIIKMEAIRSCLAGRPASYQLEEQIQDYEKSCRCYADHVSQNITRQDIVEYERNKGVVAGELMDKAAAAFSACKADLHK